VVFLYIKNMVISLDDVKTAVSRLLEETLQHVQSCEELMNYLRCKEDILYFRYVPEALIQLRALLDRVNIGALAAVSPAGQQGDLTYREPALSPPDPADLELGALFQFFRRMHVTLWELRVKLKGLVGVVRMVKDLEKAALLLRLLKNARDAIEVCWFFVRSPLGCFVPSSLSRSCVWSFCTPLLPPRNFTAGPLRLRLRLTLLFSHPARRDADGGEPPGVSCRAECELSRGGCVPRTEYHGRALGRRGEKTPERRQRQQQRRR
jgi:hypothetical protein